MNGLPVHLLTSVPVVVAVGTVAAALLVGDLVRRELTPAESRRGGGPRSGVGSRRAWGILATVLFVCLVALRFVALGT